MRRWRSMRGLRAVLFIIGLAAIMAGCTLTVPYRSSLSVSNGLPDHLTSTVPGTDAQLANHERGRVIVRMEDGYRPEDAADGLDAQIVRSIPGLNAAMLEIPANMQVVDALRQLGNVEGVRYVDPNYTYQTANVGAPAFVDGRQWGPQKIGAPVAWERSTGSPNVVIAVIDSGVDASHPELIGKVLPGINTITAGSDDTRDAFGHGTHVAAIAAAWGSEGDPIDGMMGIAWDSRILPVKVLSNRGAGSVASIAEGILAAVDWYVAERQLQPALRMVINLSLGGRGYSMLMQEAVDAALANDIVVVAAMGNDSRGQLNFPAGYPGVIAVGATDPKDARAAFSTSGGHISVAAPGVDIHSAVPGGKYARWSGTSMATPHVAGATALILADNPTLSVREVKALLESTTDRSDGVRFDDRLGFGRINVGRAIVGETHHEYGTVVVTVVTDGGAVPHANLLLMDGMGRTIATRRTDSLGEALFFAVPVGVGYRVGSSYVTGGLVSEPFDVVSDEVRHVVLRVRAQ